MTRLPLRAALIVVAVIAAPTVGAIVAASTLLVLLTMALVLLTMAHLCVTLVALSPWIVVPVAVSILGALGWFFNRELGG